VLAPYALRASRGLARHQEPRKQHSGGGGGGSDWVETMRKRGGGGKTSRPRRSRTDSSPGTAVESTYWGLASTIPSDPGTEGLLKRPSEQPASTPGRSASSTYRGCAEISTARTSLSLQARRRPACGTAIPEWDYNRQISFIA